MKRNLSACILALLAFSAYASTRVVSGLGSSGVSRAAACNSAKHEVSNSTVWQVGEGERVVSMSACECDQTKSGTWQCTVTGRLAKNENKREPNDSADIQNDSYESGSRGAVQLESGTLKGAR
jgi:hypothetical protein